MDDSKLKEILAAILEVDAGAITDDFGPAESPLWDSLNTLRIVTAVEAAFHIEFQMDEVVSMTSYAAIKTAVERHVAS